MDKEEFLEKLRAKDEEIERLAELSKLYFRTECERQTVQEALEIAVEALEWYSKERNCDVPLKASDALEQIQLQVSK